MLDGMTTIRRIAVSVSCALAVGAGASACSSVNGSASPNDGTSPVATMATTTPAVCADVTALRASVDKIKGTPIGQGALTTLSTELTAMRSTFEQLQTDASAQYSAQADAVKSAGNSLDASVRAAQRSPSATTLAAVGAGVRGVSAAVGDLTTAVGGLC